VTDRETTDTSYQMARPVSLQLNAAEKCWRAKSCYFSPDSWKISDRKNKGAHNFSFALNFSQNEGF